MVCARVHKNGNLSKSIIKVQIIEHPGHLFSNNDICLHGTHSCMLLFLVQVNSSNFRELHTFTQAIPGSPCLHNFNARVQKYGILGTRLCGGSK